MNAAENFSRINRFALSLLKAGEDSQPRDKKYARGQGIRVGARRDLPASRTKDPAAVANLACGKV